MWVCHSLLGVAHRSSALMSGWARRGGVRLSCNNEHNNETVSHCFVTHLFRHRNTHTPTQTCQSQMTMIHYNMPALRFSLTSDGVSAKVCLSIVSVTCTHKHARARAHTHTDACTWQTFISVDKYKCLPSCSVENLAYSCIFELENVNLFEESHPCDELCLHQLQ